MNILFKLYKTCLNTKNKNEVKEANYQEVLKEAYSKSSKFKMNTKSFVLVTSPSLLDLKMRTSTRYINWVYDVYSLLKCLPKVLSVYGGIGKDYKCYYYITLSKMTSKDFIKKSVRVRTHFVPVRFTFRPRKVWALNKVKSVVESPFTYPGSMIKIKWE